MKEQQQIKPTTQAKEFKFKFTTKIQPKISYKALTIPGEDKISLLVLKTCISQSIGKQLDQFDVYELNQKADNYSNFPNQDDIKDSKNRKWKYFVKILENTQRINMSQLSNMTYADKISNAKALRSKQQERRQKLQKTRSLTNIKMDISINQQVKVQLKKEDEAVKVQLKKEDQAVKIQLKKEDELVKVQLKKEDELVKVQQKKEDEVEIIDQEVIKKQEISNVESLPQCSIIQKDTGNRQTQINLIAKETAIYIQQILMQRKREIGLKLSKKIIPNKQCKFELTCNLCSSFPLCQIFYACQINFSFISCKNCIKYQQYQLPYLKFLPFIDTKTYKQHLQSKSLQQSLLNFNKIIKQQHQARNNKLKNILKDIPMPEFTVNS